MHEMRGTGGVTGYTDANDRTLQFASDIQDTNKNGLHLPNE